MSAESSAEIRLTNREHALVAGGGAGTLRIEEWEQLLASVTARGVNVERRWRTAMLGLQLAAGAGLVSAAGHLVPVLADAFRAVLFVAVFVAISLVVVLLLLRGQRVSPRLAALDLPIIRELRRVFPGASLYLGLSTKGSQPGEAVLAGALERHGEVLVFSIAATPTGSLIEVGAGRKDRGDDEEFEPSVSGITRARAAEAEAEGNPFSSLEMVALKEAHKLQRRWARLERFAARDNPMPAIDEVLAERAAREQIPPEALSSGTVMSLLREVAREAGVRLP